MPDGSSKLITAHKAYSNQIVALEVCGLTREQLKQNLYGQTKFILLIGSFSSFEQLFIS